MNQNRTRNTFRKEVKRKMNYHYEWHAYTDNLCYGRRLISRSRVKAIADYDARISGLGSYVLEKHRVAGK